MPTLFVSNTRKQHHIFYWRDPDKRLRSIQIPAGAQVPVVKNVTMQDIHAIIEQHAVYGMVSIAEATREPGEFIGLCYSIDDPVTKVDLETVFKHNDVVLKEQSEVQMEDAANAAKAAIETAVGRPAQAVTVEMVEEGDNPQIAKGFEILGETASEDTLQRVRERRSQVRPRVVNG